MTSPPSNDPGRPPRVPASISGASRVDIALDRFEEGLARIDESRRATAQHHAEERASHARQYAALARRARTCAVGCAAAGSGFGVWLVMIVLQIDRSAGWLASASAVLSAASLLLFLAELNLITKDLPDRGGDHD